MKPYRYKNMTRAKMRRKIGYLRSTNKPNFPDGANKRSWRIFWQVLFKLRLCQRQQHYF